MKYTTSSISSIVIAILSGAIPKFSPIEIIYKYLFNCKLPDYLLYSFSSIGLFSLFYTLFAILILVPLSCEFNISVNKNNISLLDRPSKEDLFYIPMIYFVYLYVLYMYKELYYYTIILGILVILLPLIYKTVIYKISDIIMNYDRCMFPLYLLVISFLVLLPVTVLYLEVVHFTLVKFIFNLGK